MSKKAKILNLAILVIFQLCVAGSVLSFSAKPELYDSDLIKDSRDPQLRDFHLFDKNFEMIAVQDLLQT